MWRLSLVTLALLTSGATAVLGISDPVPAPRTPEQVPVLLYHHLEPGAGSENGAILPVEEFEAQMAWLKAEGFTGITAAELGAWLAGEGTLPERPVLITFDDGYRSNYEHAYPVLRRHRLKATIFLVSSYAGKQIGDLEYLSAEEMAEMERDGLVELQAHTHDGHRQVAGRPALKAWTDSAIRADLQALKRTFAQAGLKRPTAVAYPFGAYDAEAVRALAAEGIRLGFTVRQGHVRRGDPPMELKRLIIFPGTSLCQFGQLVTGRFSSTCSD